MKNKFLLLVLIISTLVFLLFVGKAYQSQALSYHFVDEDNNLALGKYLLKGEILYKDMYSQHQPLGYIFSAKVQEITSPNSLFLLIKRHREVMIAWALIWSLLLVLRFRMLLLVFVFFFELLKYFLLGHLFLSESLFVYPFIYILSWVFLGKNLCSFKEAIFLGFNLALGFLLLSPMWPVLIALSLYILVKLNLPSRAGKLKGLGVLGGGMIPLIFALNYFSPIDYFHDVFYINLKYFVPVNSEPLVSVVPKAFLTPVTSLLIWEGRSATLQVIQVLVSVLFLSWAILLTKGKWRIVLLMFVLLGLTNFRYIAPGQQEYSGFHLMPWFALLILGTAISAGLVWKTFPFKWFKFLVVTLFLIAAFLTIKETKDTLFSKQDMNKGFYIYYSTQADIGEAIKIMKGPNERLMVMPDEWLIYWQADIPHAYETLDYYAWWINVPEIHNSMEKMFEVNPPTFYYCDKCKREYLGLERFFPKYQRLIKDGQQSSLMVLKDKIENLTQDQKDKLKFYNFSIN